MFSTLSAKLSLAGIIIAALLGSGIYAYSKYIDYKKEQEALIRKDERGIVEKEVNSKTSAALEAEKKKVKTLQAELAKVYTEIDKRAETKLEQLSKAKSKEEINTVFKGVISCLEKSC